MYYATVEVSQRFKKPMDLRAQLGDTIHGGFEMVWNHHLWYTAIKGHNLLTTTDSIGSLLGHTCLDIGVLTMGQDSHKASQGMPLGHSSDRWISFSFQQNQSTWFLQEVVVVSLTFWALDIFFNTVKTACNCRGFSHDECMLDSGAWR